MIMVKNSSDVVSELFFIWQLLGSYLKNTIKKPPQGRIFYGALEKTGLRICKSNPRSLRRRSGAALTGILLSASPPCQTSCWKFEELSRKNTIKKTSTREDFLWCPGEDSNFHWLSQHAPEACASTNSATRASDTDILL